MHGVRSEDPGKQIQKADNGRACKDYVLLQVRGNKGPYSDRVNERGTNAKAEAQRPRKGSDS